MDINTNYNNAAAATPNPTAAADTKTTKTASSSEKTSSNSSNGMMDKDGFLKLFLASLQYQDPMSPMETKDMMAQMSQLTMVESITNMSKMVENMKSIFEDKDTIEKGVEFLGKQISAVDEDGTTVEGKVSEVAMKDGVLELLVNNKYIELGEITKVADYSAYAS